MADSEENVTMDEEPHSEFEEQLSITEMLQSDLDEAHAAEELSRNIHSDDLPTFRREHEDRACTLPADKDDPQQSTSDQARKILSTDPPDYDGRRINHQTKHVHHYLVPDMDGEGARPVEAAAATEKMPSSLGETGPDILLQHFIEQVAEPLHS